MLDLTQYEHVTLSLPNIKAAWDRSKDRTGLAFVIHPRMKEFMLEAAVKFPTWEFISWRPNIDREKHTAFFHRFKVVANREKLGDIWWTYNSKYESVYNISNDRISKKRERGSVTKTKDIKKALKVLAKEFGAKTLEERVDEAKSIGYSVIVGTATNRESKFRADFRNLFEKIMDSFMQDWENVRRMGEANGVDITLLGSLPTQYEDFKIAEDISKCLTSEKGAVVIIHGSDYAVVEGKEPTKVYGTDTLPEWIKRGVGMLKLIEPKQIIANVGCKISDTSFFVIKRDT